MLVLTVAHDLDELLENGCLTTIASLCEFEGEMIVTIYTTIVLVVRILGTEDGRTDRASEVLDVKLLVQSCYIRASQSTAAGMTE